MRLPNRALSLAALLLPIAACCSSATAPVAPAATAPHKTPPGSVHHVIVVSMDGLLPDAYLHPEAHGLHIPSLLRLRDGGASSEGVESVFPSVTYPSHTSMVTGVTPGRHGIFTNRAFDPLEKDYGGWRWYSEDIKSEPVWRTATKAGYHVAMVHWPVTVGAEVSFLVPEYWRASTENDKKLLRAISTPGLLDSVAAEHPDFWQRYAPPASHDDALTDIATHLIAKERPELLFLHMIEVDAEQHAHGLWSAEAKAAIENDDRQLARIIDAVAKAGIAGDTNIVVLSDHGFMDAPQAVAPGVLLRDAGLIKTDAEGHPVSWQAAVLTNGGQAYVYLHDRADAATASAVRTLFTNKAKEPGSGIARIYDEADIRAAGGDADALLALESSPGFQFVSATSGTYVAKPSYSATHGWDPHRPEMHASMLMMGAAIPHGTIPHARLIDLAPTIASWLGLPMPPVEGAPLTVAPPR